MDIRTFDLILLFGLAIIVSLVIGMNVIYIVDKRLSEITINVPQPVCPPPNIIIKTPDGRMSQARVDRINRTAAPNNKKAIEGFDVTKSNNSNIKPLTITQPEREKIVLTQGYNNSDSDGNMMYPDADYIVRYDGNGCYKDVGTEKIIKLPAKEKATICDTTVSRGNINKFSTGMMTASGNTVNHNIDFYVPLAYMGGDPYMRGSNYGTIEYDDQADIDLIGSIPVNNYDGEPNPITFVDG